MSVNVAIKTWNAKATKAEKVENQLPKAQSKKDNKKPPEKMMKTYMRAQINEMDNCSTIEN